MWVWGSIEGLRVRGGLARGSDSAPGFMSMCAHARAFFCLSEGGTVQLRGWVLIHMHVLRVYTYIYIHAYMSTHVYIYTHTYINKI